jgi:hypothetical protein
LVCAITTSPFYVPSPGLILAQRDRGRKSSGEEVYGETPLQKDTKTVGTER